MVFLQKYYKLTLENKELEYKFQQHCHTYKSHSFLFLTTRYVPVVEKSGTSCYHHVT